ncbi:unnamed protein product [Ectocarpus sp. CCAP 1310/34]|nr:unnamed protein product [Ectocarpus sp. CCAP 1310/34]
MGRSRVDPAAAAKGCKGVRSGSMSRKAAAAAFGVNGTSLLRRLRCECAMDTKAGRNYIPLTKADLQERVRQLWNDGRPIPWDPDNGPGRAWLSDSLGRHERINLRLARIYEANRMTSLEDERVHKFYDFWQQFVHEHKPEPDHAWNTDESGEHTVVIGVLAHIGVSAHIGVMAQGVREKSGFRMIC